MESITLGSFRIALVRAATYLWDGGVLFGVVPKTLWSRKAPCDELNRVRMAFNCYVVETGERTILVETGGGDKLEERQWERMGLPGGPPPLAESLARAGIDPERIDLVVNTHLHWDHCGGNTIWERGRARPAFPRAAYVTRRGEWEHAHERHIRDAVSYIDASYDPLVESGRMCLIEEDAEVSPGVWLRHAPGHNRDMMVLTAASEGQTFCFFSDLVPLAAHVQPTWVAAFDLFPVEVIDNKLRWLTAALRGDWICGLGHDPGVGFCRIRGSAPKFECQPLASRTAG